MQNSELEQFKQALQQALRDIEALAASRDAASEVVELDQTRTGRVSRMDAMQQQAMATANRDRANLERQQLLAALKRIENGSFGYCTGCGEPIARQRLAAKPTVTRCVDCAAKLEQR